MRRVFWMALGATAGLLVVRRLRSTAARLTPEGVLGGLAERFSAFVEEVRAGMAEREVELRAALGLDGRHDAVDAPSPDQPNA